MRALATVNAEGTATFTADCGVTVWDSRTEVIWTVESDVRTACVATRTLRIVTVRGATRRRCTSWGIWSDWFEAYGVEAGYTGPTTYAAMRTGIGCGIWPGTYREWKQSTISWKVEYVDGFARCYSYNAPARLRRIDEYGNILELPVYSSFTSDPMVIASPHGFMADGVRIWVIPRTYDDGYGTFSPIGPEIDDIPKFMEVHHTRMGAAGVQEAAPATILSTMADGLQCKTIITLADAIYFLEFQKFCVAIWAASVIYGTRESSSEALRILAESGDTSRSNNPRISGIGLRIGTTREK
jgi:hypothetical protein